MHRETESNLLLRICTKIEKSLSPTVTFKSSFSVEVCTDTIKDQDTVVYK